MEINTKENNLFHYNPYDDFSGEDEWEEDHGIPLNFETDGYVMLLDDWIHDVLRGMYVDYDGFGCYATEDEEVEAPSVLPSHVFNKSLDMSYKYIVWYNR